MSNGSYALGKGAEVGVRTGLLRSVGAMFKRIERYGLQWLPLQHLALLLVFFSGDLSRYVPAPQGRERLIFRSSARTQARAPSLRTSTTTPTISTPYIASIESAPGPAAKRRRIGTEAPR
jgi:hypothetical protein